MEGISNPVTQHYQELKSLRTNIWTTQLVKNPKQMRKLKVRGMKGLPPGSQGFRFPLPSARGAGSIPGQAAKDGRKGSHEYYL